jgi:3-hydroxyisobutyrate dehydrogenase-like beta-hydroxyacid dehydrogenase
VPLSDDDSQARFSIRNARKDLRYYTNMTEQLPVPSPIGETIHQSFVLAETQGYGDRFVPRMIDMMMQLAGVKKK